MGSYRDTMQVCLNGHVITDRFNTSPEFRKNFCTECGEKTITKCPNCKADIPGDMLYDSIVVLGGFGSFAPKICDNCGSKFPWFETRKKQDAEELAKLKAEEEEKKLEKKLATVKKIEVKIEGHGNVVNLGSMIDNVISNTLKLTQAGDKEIAIALENLTKAISSDTGIEDNEKQQYLEQLNTLSEEALKPVDKRLPKSVLQTIINFGLGTLSATGNIAKIWSTWGPAIKSFFLG
jgi:hypothetical protein